MDKNCIVRPYEQAAGTCDFCGLPLSSDFLIEYAGATACYACFVNLDLEHKPTKKTSGKIPGQLGSGKKQKIKAPKVKAAKAKTPVLSGELNGLLLFLVGVLAVMSAWMYKGDFSVGEDWTPKHTLLVQFPETLTSLQANTAAMLKKGSNFGIKSIVTKQKYEGADGIAYITKTEYEPPWTQGLYRFYIMQFVNRVQKLGLKPLGKDKLVSLSGKDNKAITVLFRDKVFITLETEKLSPQHHNDALNEALETLL